MGKGNCRSGMGFDGHEVKMGAAQVLKSQTGDFIVEKGGSVVGPYLQSTDLQI